MKIAVYTIAPSNSNNNIGGGGGGRGVCDTSFHSEAEGF